MNPLDDPVSDRQGDEAARLRAKILELVRQYSELELMPEIFDPATSAVPSSGKVIGTMELEYLVDASLDGWLTAGRFNTAFEARLGKYLGVTHARTTNSGSSANLLAVSAMVSPKLKENRTRPGDEVITVAAGFPTTVNPMLVNRLVPVFVDVSLPTYNIDTTKVEEAIGPRTRGIVIAHTLGNPFDLDEITRIARQYGLWLIEDCCDALGSRYKGRSVGTFGDIGTLSFYPAHHITMGEGGCVFTSDELLNKILLSIRDWGRDCHCPPGRENTCGRRFDWQLGNLPAGYDHKYTYSHLGYNLKITDMQAAIALAQMERVDKFIEARKRNFHFLREHLQSMEEFFILPEATAGSEPSWFGFPITLRDGLPWSRKDIQISLAKARIGTRLLFAGNLTRQPYFQDYEYRISGVLTATDIVMENTFWIGLYPGLSEDHLEHSVDTLGRFVRS